MDFIDEKYVTLNETEKELFRKVASILENIGDVCYQQHLLNIEIVADSGATATADELESFYYLLTDYADSEKLSLI